MDSQNASNTEKQSQGKDRASTRDTAKPLPASSTVREVEVRRQEKIQEHLARTLDSPDTLQACMGPIACDLLEMLQGLKQGINQAFAAGPMAMEGFDNLRSTIELYARLANQAYKLANLEQRMKQADEVR